MRIRNYFPLMLSCGLLLSVAPSMRGMSVQTIPQTLPKLMKPALLLVPAAFVANYICYYLDSKLWSWDTKEHKDIKNGLLSAATSTWAISNLYVLRSLLSVLAGEGSSILQSEHGLSLATLTFLGNYVAGHLSSKLWHWNTGDTELKHVKRGLLGAIASTWVVANLYLTGSTLLGN